MEVNLQNQKTLSKRVRAMIFALALFLAGGIGFGVERTIAQQSSAPLPSPQDLSRTFIGIAKQVKPAVVNIDVTEEVKRNTSSLRQRGGSQIPFPFELPDTPRRRQGTGSGVIVSPDGYILTNEHVAGKASKMKVKLSDGREFTAKLVGTDPETDLAVIKIDADNLTYAKLGNSDVLEQGEWVIALGSPFGLDQTMTAGIVSALGRDLSRTGQQFTKFIQTDASINPGNSGGPLINMNGEVVGINSMIYSQSGASEGIGFSIPANLASKIYGQLVKNGKVQRGYLGVGLYPAKITPALARSLNFKGTEGALVRDLADPHGPAAKAGLKSGDVIIEVDGKAVTSSSQLIETVADLPVGKSVRVKYVRDGVEQTANIVLAERNVRNNQNDLPEDEENEPEETGVLGLGVTNVTPEAVTQLKLKVRSGVIVTSIQPDSPAADAGISKGTVIYRMNGKPITNRQDFLREVANLKGEKEIVLQIERGGVMDFVTVTLD